MKISLAKSSGFCIGVRDAVLRIVNEINSSATPISVYGPLIHSPQTIDILNKRGLATIDSLDDINGRIIAVRTHGIPLDKSKEIEARACRYINLTCPRVARVQRIIEKYSGDDYFTIITGDKGHAEVAGLISYAKAGSFVISNPGDVKNVPAADKYLLVSQTTFDSNQFNIITEELRKKKYNIKIFNTICDSTHKRQVEVIETINSGIDTLIVIGGKNSANTRRLAHIGNDNGIRTFHVETEAELNESDFTGKENVLVTAGASTPGWIINNTLEKLYNIKFAKGNRIVNIIKKLYEIIIRSDLLSGFCAFFNTLFVQSFIGIKPDYYMGLMSFLSVYSIEIIKDYIKIESFVITNPLKFSLLSRFKKFFIPVSFLSAVISIMISFKYGLPAAVIISLIIAPYYFSFIKELVNTGLFKKHDPITIYPRNKFLTLMLLRSTGAIKRITRNLFIFRSFAVPLVWIIITIIIPLIYYNANTADAAAALSFFYALLFLRNTLLDIVSCQGDMIMGRETIPVLMSYRWIISASAIISAAGIILFGFSSYVEMKPVFLIYILNIVYFTVLLLKIINIKFLITLKYEFIINLNYLLFILVYILTVTS